MYIYRLLPGSLQLGAWTRQIASPKHAEAEPEALNSEPSGTHVATYAEAELALLQRERQLESIGAHVVALARPHSPRPSYTFWRNTAEGILRQS